MATNADRYGNTSNSSFDVDEKSILTLQGYSELFEKCEKTSDLFFCYETLFQKKKINEWIAELKSKDDSNPITRLFSLPSELFPAGKSMKSGDTMNIVQFYSLLENVYRNVLLRPYIPAYRTINTDCGRYRSFIKPLGNILSCGICKLTVNETVIDPVRMCQKFGL